MWLLACCKGYEPDAAVEMFSVPCQLRDASMERFSWCSETTHFQFFTDILLNYLTKWKLIKCHLSQSPDCINKGLGFEFLEKECLHLINREDNNPHRQKGCERAKIAGINCLFNCCFHYFTSQVDMQDFKSDFYLPQFKFLPFFFNLTDRRYIVP